MKKFKAMLAATAAVMALSAVSVPMSAFAFEESQRYNLTDGAGTWNPDNLQGQVTGETPQAQINVDFTIAPAYTVTIPADVRIPTMPDGEGDGSRYSVNEVRVQNVFLNKGKAVQVSVASANAYQMLLDATDTGNKVPYSLRGVYQVGDVEATEGVPFTIVDRTQNNPNVPGENVFNKIITVPTGNTTKPGRGMASLIYSIKPDETIPVAGTYSDRLTFKIEVVEASDIGVDPQLP